MAQRLREHCGFIAWQVGVSYLLLWGVTYWTLAEGGAVFGQSGVCHADSAQVLFYWACDPASPLEILATMANFALTTTVWAPVFVAAATVDPDAVILAVLIVAVHVIGLPLGILVTIRVLARTFDAVAALRRDLRAGSLTAAGEVAGTQCPAERSDQVRPAPT